MGDAVEEEHRPRPDEDPPVRRWGSATGGPAPGAHAEDGGHADQGDQWPEQRGVARKAAAARAAVTVTVPDG